MWVRFQKQSIECQLYFWILKSYKHGVRIGGERDSRPKHITAWTKNAAEKICMRLRSSACVRLRLHASASVCVCPRACVCAQKIKRPDASRRKKFLRPDASFVQGLSGCTIHIRCGGPAALSYPYLIVKKRRSSLSSFAT